jgi:hypothetical protein
MDFSIPRPLKTEHDELHEELARATQVGDRTGAAAREVAMADRLKSKLPQILAEH